jgi:hypothetical protein
MRKNAVARISYNLKSRVHIYALLYYIKQDPLMRVERFFHTSNYLDGYGESILPLSVSSLNSDTFLPSVARRRRRRPRIARIRSASEN